MSTSTLTTKFQTTIPRDVRESLNLQVKDRLSFTVMHDGTVMMRVKKNSILDLAGAAGVAPKPLSIEAMRAWRA